MLEISFERCTFAAVQLGSLGPPAQHVSRLRGSAVADGDVRHVQFSPSPNGKVREVSEAKKRALAGNNIFNDAQVSRGTAMSQCSCRQQCGPVSAADCS